MAETQTKPVYAVEVRNISPNANDKTVSDFFSFCGKITKLFLDKEEGKETSRAVVEFETESAAKTALLLTNALIVDRPITVSSFPPKEVQVQQVAPVGTPVPPEKIIHRDFGGVHDDDRSKTSVVASMLASGYVLATDALAKAKHYDDEHNITLQLKVGVEQLKVKAHELDQTYGISEKAAAVKLQATEKAKQMDEEYKISEKASNAADKVKATATTVASKAQENQTINSAVESVKTGWQTVTTSVQGIYQEYKDQTQRAIEEKQRQRVGSQAAPLDVPISTESLPPQQTDFAGEGEKKEEIL